MSDVYRARDEQSGRTVALKIVRSGDPEFARRLAQEARALERLAFPGLIGLLDTGFDGDQAFLVMELIEGETLAQRLRSGGPLTSMTTAVLGARLGGALGFVHERGIVHRDVKPSNVLLDADGQAWLSDFGIAQLHDATTITVDGSTMGTVSYMAPEQLDDHQVGPAADIWSLGVVLLECLTGRRVYEGSPSEIVAHRVARPLVVPPDLPTPWRLILRGMLDPDPAQRPSGPEVASLLGAPAFDVVWVPVDPEATVRLAALGGSDETVPLPGVVVGAFVDTDATRVSASPTTPATSSSEESHATRGAGSRRLLGTWGQSRTRWAAAVVGAFVVGLVVVLMAALPQRSALTATTTTVRAPATVRDTTTTTVVVSPASTALAKLVRDAAAGQAAGTVASSSALTITNAAGAALADQGLGNTALAQSYLQTAASDVATGEQAGLVTVGEGATLQRDLVVLADSLGLTAPSATPASPPTSGVPGGPGHGKGRGQGNQP